MLLLHSNMVAKQTAMFSKALPFGNKSIKKSINVNRGDEVLDQKCSKNIRFL